MRDQSPDRWLLFAEGPRRRWGGDIRRALVFAALAERVGATVVEGFAPATVERSVRRARGRFPRFRGAGPRVVSSELLATRSISVIRRMARPVALDVHDDPVAQLRVLDPDADPALLADLASRMRHNTDAFPILVAPSETFADLARLPADRRIIASNGTDTRHVTPSPFPDRPTIGMVSGASPARGIETLIASARMLRTELPDLRLDLWLVATGPASEAFLAELQAATSDDPWISIGTAPYQHLGEALGRSTVLCIPHPSGEYLDSALPIKLFDSMAAGRPVVTTPRLEARLLVERHDVGRVSTDDSAESIAAAIRPLLLDQALATRLGANGRAVACAEFDWGVIGGRLADEIVRRVG